MGKCERSDLPLKLTDNSKILYTLIQVGFEMMIYSFGSGFSLESNDSKYLDNIRDDIAYAHWNGIEVTSLLLVSIWGTSFNVRLAATT